MAATLHLESLVSDISWNWSACQWCFLYKISYLKKGTDYLFAKHMKGNRNLKKSCQRLLREQGVLENI